MKRKVLIVDDDRNFLDSLSEYLADEMPEVEVCSAYDGDEAVKFLENHPIDLLVTDLKMPRMDGLVLLAYMSNHHPHTPVIVLTAFGGPDTEEQTQELGAARYVEKPVDLEILKEKMSSLLASKVEGRIRGITVPAFLQVLEMEKTTCTMTIKSLNGEGRLFFRQGRLIEAQHDGKSGADAALLLIALENAEIEIHGEDPGYKNAVAMDLKHLIIEALRQKDERERTG